MKQALLLMLMVAGSSLSEAGVVYPDDGAPLATSVVTGVAATEDLASDALVLVLSMNTVSDLTPGSDAGGMGSPIGVGTYSNLVNVAANLALGDLYRQLSIDFALGLAPAITASFLADANLVMVAGPRVDDVPQSVTLLLCGITLVAMAILRRLPDEML